MDGLDVPTLEDEFWWMTLLGRSVSGWVGVAQNIWTPPPERPGWARHPARVPVEGLATWAMKLGQLNVHRTLTVYDGPESSSGVTGPFVVDIDGNEPDDGEIPPDTDRKALSLARTVAAYYLERRIPRSHLRLYRSGHKGYQVHLVLPNQGYMWEAAGWQPSWEAEIRSLRRRFLPRARLELDSELSIDKPHNYIRLRESWNGWGRDRRGRCERIEL